MYWVTVVAVILAGWLALVGAGIWCARRYLVDGPRGDALLGLIWHANRFVARRLHRVTYDGLEQVPQTNVLDEGMIVVSNHTGAVDPLLIQAACRFEIRWMMAKDMMADELRWIWRLIRVIPVARRGADAGALREAIRHVRSGGAIGIFPEGGIVDPPRQVRPFHHGVGAIVSRTGAQVLLVWLRDTPETTDMLSSIVRPSRARVTFVDVLQFERGESPESITQALRQRIADESGWPLNDEPLPINERADSGSGAGVAMTGRSKGDASRAAINAETSGGRPGEHSSGGDGDGRSESPGMFHQGAPGT